MKVYTAISFLATMVCVQAQEVINEDQNMLLKKVVAEVKRLKSDVSALQQKLEQDECTCDLNGIEQSIKANGQDIVEIRVRQE